MSDEQLFYIYNDRHQWETLIFLFTVSTCLQSQLYLFSKTGFIIKLN